MFSIWFRSKIDGNTSATNTDRDRRQSAIAVKPLLVTTCIKRSPVLRDQCYDTTPLLKSIV